MILILDSRSIQVIDLHLGWIASNARAILLVESKDLLAIRFEAAFFAD